MSRPEAGEKRKVISRQRENAADSGEPDPFLGIEPARVDAHRLLPQSVDAEQGILSSVMIAPRDIMELCERRNVTTDWFHVPAHGLVFNALRDMFREGKPVDFITVTERLRDTGLLAEAGGVGFVTSLFTFLPTAANASYYLEIAEKKHFLREVIKTCTGIASEAYEAEDTEELKQTAEEFLSKFAEPENAKRQRSIRDLTMATMTKVAGGKCEEAWGLSTGFATLDSVARGLRAESMIAIGGETSAGKTSLALNIVHNLCVKRGIPTLIFTLEMTSEEITEVLLQIGSGVNLDNATEGRVNEAEVRALHKASEALAKAPLTVRDEKDVSVIQARSIARRVKPRLIVGDYAQLFTGGKKKYERADLEVADISRGFKKMAGELGATCLLLTQLNDDGKVAGSRAIAKDADQLWNVSVDESDEETRWVKICKQRRGKKDRIPFRFIGPAQKFLPKAI